MTITSEMAVTKKLRITSSNNSKITFNADVGWFYI